jgi:hypothetical protein
VGSFPISLEAGQVSAVDDMSPAPASVVNICVDAAGINRPRPGLVTYTTTGLGTSPLIGLYVWQTWVIGVTADRKLWALPSVVPTVWQALSDATAATQLDGAERPVFAEDGLRVVIVGGGSIQQWQGAGLSSRLGGGPTCTHIASIGGRFVANNTAAPQEFDWSNLGDGVHATWDALAFTEADARPDPVVAIYENLRELYVFGATTTQVYSVGTDPFNPWDNTIASNIGLSAAYSVVRLDDNFAMLDDRRRFIITDGRTNQPISDAISKDLRNLGTIDDCWGYREELENFSLVVWHFPAEGRTFVYNLTRKTWSERKYYSAPFQVAMPISAHVYWPALNIHLIANDTTAALYTLDPDIHADIGGTLLCERYTGWNDMGNKLRKRDNELVVTLRRGTVASGHTQSALEVRCRDDGGAWSDFDFVLLGEAEDSEQTVKVFLGGVYRRRLYHFRYSGSDNTSLVSAEQFYEQLDMEEAA